MTIEVLIIVILIGISIFILFPVVETISSYMSSGAKGAVCSLSLIGGANKARCPVEQVSIFDDKIEILKSGESKPEVRKPSAKQSITLFQKDQIAQFLKNCLDKGGGVNSKAFSRENKVVDERVCLQCYTLDIKGSSQIDGMLDYLSTTKSTRDRYYLDELTRDDAHKKAYILYGTEGKFTPSNGEQPLKQGTQYTIFFLGQKKGKIPSFFTSAANIPENGIAMAFLQNNDAFFSYVAESSKLGEVCQRLVN